MGGGELRTGGRYRGEIVSWLICRTARFLISFGRKLQISVPLARASEIIAGLLSFYCPMRAVGE